MNLGKRHAYLKRRVAAAPQGQKRARRRDFVRYMLRRLKREMRRA